MYLYNYGQYIVYVECANSAAAAGVGFSSFNALALQAMLSSLCTLKEDLKGVLKHTRDESSGMSAVTSAFEQVRSLRGSGLGLHPSMMSMRRCRWMS